MLRATRAEVYAVLDGERAYQDERWTPDTTNTNGQHSVGEFVLFMEDYLAQARQQLSRNGEPQASNAALDTLRKVTAMGVACMEQNGAVPRAKGTA